MRANQARLLAEYNRWMNGNLMGVAATLDDGVRKEDRGAFFRSIHGTFNHLLLADRIWLGRIIGKPFAAGSLADELYGDFDQLRRERATTDSDIERWAGSLSDEALAATFEFHTFSAPEPRRCALWKVVTHLFNHQAHHRGQLTAMLSQVGVDYGVTDLLWMDGVMDAL